MMLCGLRELMERGVWVGVTDNKLNVVKLLMIKKKGPQLSLVHCRKALSLDEN